MKHFLVLSLIFLVIIFGTVFLFQMLHNTPIYKVTWSTNDGVMNFARVINLSYDKTKTSIQFYNLQRRDTESYNGGTISFSIIGYVSKWDTTFHLAEVK